MKSIILAILFLAPQLGIKTTNEYAQFINRESKRYHVDPLLVTTIIHVESSWNRYAVSETWDHGLGQLHVSKTTNPHLLGKEEILFDPATNIRYTGRTLAMWKAYHDRTCDQKAHPFWSHYQYGYVVKDLKWTKKVTSMYRRLVKKFRHNEQQYEWEQFVSYLTAPASIAH